MKIRLVGAEFFHTDGRTDMTKLIVAFRNFAKEPKNRGTINYCEVSSICKQFCHCHKNTQ